MYELMPVDLNISSMSASRHLMLSAVKQAVDK